MKRLVILFWIVLLVTTVFSQQFKWLPRSFPLSVPCKVSEEVDYHFGIQRITCFGRASGGYLGYISAGFKGFFIHDKWLSMPKETPKTEDVIKDVAIQRTRVINTVEAAYGLYNSIECRVIKLI